ncbi:MAG: TrpB-like pyridoxal phosphate-dependent enzyme [Chloroflexi bacterium]|nr:TrpB-like pyridoxal phosphate-dependent enzyme [Chloroflexota bacterium]
MRIAPERKDFPDAWYNVVPDLTFPAPNMRSPSGYRLGPHDLEPFVPDELIKQELEQEQREISIPKPLQEYYSDWRPTALYRAERLEKELGTPAKIFFKLEGVTSYTYEANTAVAQAYYAREQGVKRLVTGTGNGEWGVSLAMATNVFNLESSVYMVRSSYEEKPHGRYVMEVLDTEVIPSPSDRTATGREQLEQDPDSPGSLGLALSAAFEDASRDKDTKFAWGTVMNHVLLHQTVIGLEAKRQMRRAGGRPDILISAVGGGSAFGGLMFPFYKDLLGKARFIAVEAAEYPSLTKGQYGYDYGDSQGLAPMIKMYTLGRGYMPPKMRAGGMRYHGMSPLISALYREKQIEARAYTQHEALGAAVTFARAEGVIPAPESAYAVKAVIDEAIACRENRERKTILCVISANSNLDIESFHDFVDGSDSAGEGFSESASQAALSNLPTIQGDE